MSLLLLLWCDCNLRYASIKNDNEMSKWKEKIMYAYSFLHTLGLLNPCSTFAEKTLVVLSWVGNHKAKFACNLTYALTHTLPATTRSRRIVCALKIHGYLHGIPEWLGLKAAGGPTTSSCPKYEYMSRRSSIFYYLQVCFITQNLSLA